MEKFLRPNDVENMRMAMIKHEKMFRAQKMLMKHTESATNLPKQNRWTTSTDAVSYKQINRKPPQRDIDLEQPADQSDRDEIQDESVTELTLGPRCYRRTRKEKSEQFNGSKAGSGLSSTFTRNQRTTRIESSGQNWGQAEVPEAKLGLLGRGRGSSGGDDEQLRQNQQPWLFLKALSLNMT